MKTFFKQLFCWHDIEILDVHDAHLTFGTQGPITVWVEGCTKCLKQMQERKKFFITSERDAFSQSLREKLK